MIFGDNTFVQVWNQETPMAIGELVFIQGEQEQWRIKDIQHQYVKEEGWVYMLSSVLLVRESQATMYTGEA